MYIETEKFFQSWLGRYCEKIRMARNLFAGERRHAEDARKSFPSRTSSGFYRGRGLSVRRMVASEADEGILS